MTWKDIEPNVFRSDWGGAESIYRRISLSFSHIAREHWRIHCICDIKIIEPSLKIACAKIDIASLLQHAWINLGMEFPGLTVVPEGVTSKLFHVLEPERIKEWTDETFFVETTHTADEIIANSEPRSLPSLYWLPSSSQIVFLSSHWRIDGIGCCMLLNRLFALAAAAADPSSNGSVEYGKCKQQLARISPALEDAAGCPPEMTGPAADKLKDYATKYIDDFHQKAIHSGGLPYQGDSTTAPRNTAHQDLTLTEISTATLIAACKKRGISVTAAIHTALAHTVFSFTHPGDQSDYTTVIAVNLRGYLPQPYSTMQHACQTYVGSIIRTICRHDQFTTSAAKLSKYYKTWHSEEFIKSLPWIYRIHADRLFNSPPPKTRPLGEPVSKPPSGVTLSSLGIIEQYLKGNHYGGTGDEDGAQVQVHSFRFGVTMMTRQMLLYLWTFRGLMTLSVNYNEAYYSTEMVRDVLARITGALKKELEVDLDFLT